MKLLTPALALALFASGAGAAQVDRTVALRGTCTVVDTLFSAAYRGEVARTPARGGGRWVGFLKMEDADRDREIASRLDWVHRAPGFGGGCHLERPIAVEIGEIADDRDDAGRLRAFGAGEVFEMASVPVRMAVACDLVRVSHSRR